MALHTGPPIFPFEAFEQSPSLLDSTESFQCACTPLDTPSSSVCLTTGRFFGPVFDHGYYHNTLSSQRQNAASPRSLFADGYSPIKFGFTYKKWIQPNDSYVTKEITNALSSRVHLSGVASADTANSGALVNALVYSCKADEDGMSPSWL